MSCFFISGHGDLTLEEFEEHYHPMIEKALSEDGWFVIGDYKGADTMANKFLSDYLFFNKSMFPYTEVIVYHVGDKPRNNPGRFETFPGFSSDEERDATMTRHSSVDIAWVRPGRENSGTARNIARRKA